MSDEEENFIVISSEAELLDLVGKIKMSLVFADTFKFGSEELFDKLLENLGIHVQEFVNKPFYHSVDEDLVISKSSDGYVLISTMGLVSRKKISDNIKFYPFFIKNLFNNIFMYIIEYFFPE